MSSVKLVMAKRIVNEVFTDQSVPKEKTIEDLKELQDEIEMMLDALQKGG